jgi:hypothetical protein
MMRVGLIQTRGIGDIIIALPIAQYYIAKGYEVVWPIDARFTASFAHAGAGINFQPVAPDSNDSKDIGSYRYFYQEPMQILQEHKCDAIYVLYSRLGDFPLVNERYSQCLKFDEYKYAVAKVPFSQKWKLRVTRDTDREVALLRRVATKKPYAVLHLEGSSYSADQAILAPLLNGLDAICIKQETDNIFDWLRVIEKASRLIMVDSCFSNLVEQLNLTNEKFLILRSLAPLTPVYMNNWVFM